MTAFTASLEAEVLKYIRENQLVLPGEKVLVAVSGGPDSVCLLYCLAALREKLGFELHIAHLDHRLRGEASAADARYAAALSKRLRIPATVESRDVRAYRAGHKLTLEEAAREVRYAFLGEVAQKTGAAKIAVGHTADDQAETVLLHILRGSGLKGLAGLRPVHRRGGLTVIRPLLEISRAETEAYCRARRLKPRRDATNLDTEPTRNRVRHRLLPELQKYNPRIGEALVRLSRTAAGDIDFIEGEARRWRERYVREEGGSAVIVKKTFRALHPALQRQVLRLVVQQVLGSLKDIEAEHIEGLMDALDKPAGKVVTLPFGAVFRIGYDRYEVVRAGPAACPYPVLKVETALKIPGETLCGGWRVTADIIPKAKADVAAADGFTAYLDLARAGLQLTVRGRRSGDRFQPLGLAQPKKLNVFMIDARIPQDWRGRVPLVCGENGIIWAAGWRIDDRVKVTPATEQVLKLEFTLESQGFTGNS